MKLGLNLRHNYLISLSLIIFVAFNSCNAIDLQKISSSSAFVTRAFQVAQAVALGLGASALAGLAHECGHAIASKILTPENEFRINIGGYSEQPAKLEIGCITIRGWNLFVADTQFKSIPSSALSRILICLAGPCAGFTAAMLLSKMDSSYLYKKLCWCIMSHQMYNLVPVSMTYNNAYLCSDGGRILNDLAGKHCTDKISCITNNVIVGILIFILNGYLIDKTFGKFIFGK